MKVAVLIVRVLVGVLFIISGLVKANDPLGLSYKMQEFFEVWNGDLNNSTFFLKNFLLSVFSFLHDYSLALSIAMIALEIMAGVALLVAWKKKFILYLLLFLIIFFTFLTGYAYASGKFKNCGCFGDCLPITPFASFVKDIVLLAAILFLLIFQKYIQRFKNVVLQRIILLAALIFSLGFQWYTLTYLPIADCLPFKKGNNIPQQMKIPANAVPDSFAIVYKYKRDGKDFEFTPENLPADLDNYEYIDRIDKLIRKGNAEPPIKGFSLISASDDTDLTDQILTSPGYTILYFSNGSEDEKDRKNSLTIFQNTAVQKNIPIYGVSSNAVHLKNLFNQLEWNYPIMRVDVTAFRSAARANPTIYLIKKGTVINKWSLANIEEAIERIKKIN